MSLSRTSKSLSSPKQYTKGAQGSKALKGETPNMLISGGDVNVSYNRRVKQSLAKIKVDKATNLVVLTVNPKLDKVKGSLNEKAVSAKQMFANYRGGK